MKMGGFRIKLTKSFASAMLPVRTYYMRSSIGGGYSERRFDPRGRGGGGGGGRGTGAASSSSSSSSAVASGRNAFLQQRDAHLAEQKEKREEGQEVDRSLIADLIEPAANERKSVVSSLAAANRASIASGRNAGSVASSAAAGAGAGAGGSGSGSGSISTAATGDDDDEEEPAAVWSGLPEEKGKIVSVSTDRKTAVRTAVILLENKGMTTTTVTTVTTTAAGYKHDVTWRVVCGDSVVNEIDLESKTVVVIM